MSKKKKSMTPQRRTNLTTQGNAESDNMDSNMDEEKNERMKKNIIKEKPEFKEIFQVLEKMDTDRKDQAQNSFSVLKNERGEVTPELLMQYPNSPTAKQTMVALNHYQSAFCVLWSYTKSRVLIQSDCEIIQPGLHHYIEGFMIASYMSQQFPLPPTIEDLVLDYLRIRPNDILVEYFYTTIIVLRQSKRKSDYEGFKDMIRAHEKFVHKLLPYKTVGNEKRLLGHSYYILGAMYASTDQNVRALDAFEKYYALDEENIEALYAVAFQYKDKEPEKALKLCNKYLELAPKCDEKFPNIHYVMGYIYALHFKNIKLAKNYYELGMAAESYRLPFNPPTDCGPKSILQAIVPLARMKREHVMKALGNINLKL